MLISGGNSLSFENWDTNAADDFSGVYDDLNKHVQNIYKERNRQSYCRY